MSILRPIVIILFALSLLAFLAAAALPAANWEYARFQVERALHDQPTLQRDLLALDLLAGEWEQTVGAASYLKPFTAATDLAKNGNAWNGLVALLDFGHPGSGLALRLLDEISGELVDQQARLVQLATLDDAAAVTGYFLEMPDRATMVTLRQVYAPQLTPMHEFQSQAAEWAPTLVTIRGNLSALDQALDALGRDPNPIYQGVTALLIPAISPLHGYVAGLSETISEQADRLPGDIAAMRAVVTAVDQALAWEALLAAAAPGVGNTLARVNLLLFLGLFTVLADASTGHRRVR